MTRQYRGMDDKVMYKEIDGYPIGISDKRTVEEKISIGMLMVAAAGTMLVEISINHMIMSSIMFLAAIALSFPKQTNRLLTNFEKLQRKMGFNLYGVLFAVLTVVFLLDFATGQANAAFFTSTEAWMSSIFPGINGGAISLVFNVLRGLFVVYIGVALVKVVSAARNDEDWQTLARTPLIIAVTVILGDLLANLVTGSGGAGGAGGTPG